MVLDDWELETIRQEYGTSSELTRLDWTPAAVLQSAEPEGRNDVIIYDLSGRLSEIRLPAERPRGFVGEQLFRFAVATGW